MELMEEEEDDKFRIKSLFPLWFWVVALLLPFVKHKVLVFKLTEKVLSNYIGFVNNCPN